MVESTYQRYTSTSLGRIGVSDGVCCSLWSDGNLSLSLRWRNSLRVDCLARRQWIFLDSVASFVFKLTPLSKDKLERIRKLTSDARGELVAVVIIFWRVTGPSSRVGEACTKMLCASHGIHKICLYYSGMTLVLILHKQVRWLPPSAQTLALKTAERRNVWL